MAADLFRSPARLAQPDGPSAPPPRRRGAAATLALAFALPACAGSGAPGTPDAHGACTLAGPAGSAPPALTVAMAQPVDPSHAPIPRNLAERFVFAQLYEPLVRIACDGRVEPALALSWSPDDDGLAWTFTLRPDLRDWRDRPVTAADVARGWVGSGDREGIAGVRALDARTLRVRLRQEVDIGFFARSELAVASPDPGSRWPIGTGPYRPDGAATSVDGPVRRLTLLPLTGGPRLDFRSFSGDPRNPLDAGADLLVTDDADAIAYAASSPAFEPVPLPWETLYLLLLTGEGTPTQPEPGELDALARDAVRVNARASRHASADLRACVRPGYAEAVARSPARRIAHPAGDAVAGALAERLVAMARNGVGSGWVAGGLIGADATAAGLGGQAFADALRTGGAAAFVLPVERGASGDPCAALRALLARAPWLGRGAVIPLVETRRTALVRRGVAGLTADAFGTLRFAPDRPR